MSSRLDRIMAEAGVPQKIVIYQRQGAWRYAVYHAREVSDGRLRTTLHTSREVAQREAEEMLTGLYARFYQGSPVVTWDPPDARGMVSGAIQTAP
jgi:hypothetical protein